MTPSEFTRGVVAAFDSKRVEPQKRLVGGRFGWAAHRYPIKGGISLTESLWRDMNQPNPLWERLDGRA